MKSFRPDTLDQILLLPPSLQDWLPDGHLAGFIADVVNSLDLGAIYASYEEDGRGQAAYHPAMMVRLLLYGYCSGTYSSRQMQRETYEDVAFRYLAGDQHPDHSTLAEFRKRHLGALAGLFTQALQLCAKAGLVKLGHVAVDGSKIQGNASKHKAMSYGRMEEAETKLKAEVEELLAQANATDEAEDQKYGKGQRGDELPVELARRESRLAKIAAAKAALEAEAKQAAEEKKAAAEAKIAERRAEEAETGKKASGREPVMPDPGQAVPDAKAQRNFSDPESRIMPDGAHKGSFVQGYNAQIVVDGEAQVIVAAEVTQETNDRHQLALMLEQAEQNAGAKPEAASADHGYWDPKQVQDPRVEGIDLYVATGKHKHGQSPEPAPAAPPPTPHPATAEEASLLEQMKQKLKTEVGRNLYRMRKAIVEPVFGQIKEWRGFRRFSFRGLQKVRAEWKLICLTHNLLKLYRSGKAWQMA
jgi:transposase